MLQEMKPKVGDIVYVCDRIGNGWGPLTPRKVYEVNKHFFFVEHELDPNNCVFIFGNAEGMICGGSKFRIFLSENPSQEALDLNPHPINI
jgi:hypothetical protein